MPPEAPKKLRFAVAGCLRRLVSAPPGVRRIWCSQDGQGPRHLVAVVPIRAAGCAAFVLASQRGITAARPLLSFGDFGQGLLDSSISGKERCN